jgi:hypothetical protein
MLGVARFYGWQLDALGIAGPDVLGRVSFPGAPASRRVAFPGPVMVGGVELVMVGGVELDMAGGVELDMAGGVELVVVGGVAFPDPGWTGQLASV